MDPVPGLGSQMYMLYSYDRTLLELAQCLRNLLLLETRFVWSGYERCAGENITSICTLVPFCYAI